MALFLALLLDSSFAHARHVYRLVYFLPYAVPGVVGAIVWAYLYSPNTGPLQDAVTGVWHGLYTYPNGLSVSFVATLIESGSVLTGSTHEPSPTGTLYASLTGSRDGSAVAFHKTYEGAGPDYGNVDYAGTLNADASEIEGRWIIPGVWSGKFLMIRPARDAASVENNQSEYTLITARGIAFWQNEAIRKNPITSMQRQIVTVFTVRCSISPRTWA